MKTYLEDLEQEIETILPTNTWIELSDSIQSHVVFPTNHVYLTDDFFDIELAQVVYNSLTKHDLIMDNLQILFRKGKELSELLGDFVTILPVENKIRLIIGEDQNSTDWESIDHLIRYIDQL